VAPDENSLGYPGPPLASPAANPTIPHRLPTTCQQTEKQPILQQLINIINYHLILITMFPFTIPSLST